METNNDTIGLLIRLGRPNTNNLQQPAIEGNNI